MVCGHLPVMRLLIVYFCAWLHLRLLFCRAVWAQVCRGRAAGGGASPAAVVVAAAAFIARASCMLGLAAGHGVPACCSCAVLVLVCHWQTFQLTQEQFQERWCANDILAHTTMSAAGGIMAMHVHVPRHLQ